MAFDAQVVSNLACGNPLAASSPLGVALLALEGFPAFWCKENALGLLMLCPRLGIIHFSKVSWFPLLEIGT